MSLGLILYLIDVGENLSNFAGGMIFFSIVAMVVSAIAYGINADAYNNYKRQENKNYMNGAKKYFFRSLFAVIFFAMLNVFIPTKNTAYIMAAVSTVKSAATTEQGQHLISDAQKMLELQIQKMEKDVSSN